MMKIIENNDINRLEFEDQKDYFIRLQNYIVKNLTSEERKEYQSFIQKIDKLSNKIKFAHTWIQVAERNIEIEKKFKFIENYFPKKLKSIRKEFESKFDNEKIFFLENEIKQLKKVLEIKCQTEISKLKILLRENMNEDDFLQLIEDLNRFKTNLAKYKYLKRYFDSKIKKKN